jgi:hypothetical protein
MADVKEPLALIVKGREPEQVVAYACGTCGIVARNEQEARNCHPRRCSLGCGAEIPEKHHGSVCDGCGARQSTEREERQEARRLEHYAKAEKVPYADYDGAFMFWWDGDAGSGNGYFADVGELFEFCEDNNVDPPEWVWACSEQKLTFNAGDLIANAIENQEFYEDAREDVGGEKELQDLLDAWAAKHSPTSYFAHEGRAVDISAEVAAWRKERAEVAGA